MIFLVVYTHPTIKLTQSLSPIIEAYRLKNIMPYGKEIIGKPNIIHPVSLLYIKIGFDWYQYVSVWGHTRHTVGIFVTSGTLFLVLVTLECFSHGLVGVVNRQQLSLPLWLVLALYCLKVKFLYYLLELYVILTSHMGG